MNKYQIFTILFGLCLVIAGYFFFLLYEENAELKLQVLELNQEIYDLKENLSIKEKIINWNTFENEKYDYSIKHPVNYEAGSQDYDTEPELASWVSINSGRKGEWTYDSFDIMVRNNPNNLSSQERGEEVIDICKKDDVCQLIQEGKGTIIDGHEAIQFDINGALIDESGGGLAEETRVIYIAKKSKMFRLTFPLREESLVVFEQMLSTFKFLD